MPDPEFSHFLSSQLLSDGTLATVCDFFDQDSNCIAFYTRTSISVPVISGNPPDGIEGQPYTTTFTATGGTPPYTWSVTNPPPGLTMDNGVLSGIPTHRGTFSFTVS